jgi:hypothetical protein
MESLAYCSNAISEHIFITLLICTWGFKGNIKYEQMDKSRSWSQRTIWCDGVHHAAKVKSSYCLIFGEILMKSKYS